MYIIVDFGLVCLIIGIVLIGGIAAGGLVLEKVVSFLFGPLKIGLIILTLIFLAVNIKLGLKKEIKCNVPSRIIGIILNTVSTALRACVNIALLLCFLQEFINEVRNGDFLEVVIYTAIIIAIAVPVLILLFALSFGIDQLVINYMDKFFIQMSILNIIISIIYFMACQAFLVYACPDTVLEVFSNQKWFSDFILNSWFSALFGR